MFRQYPRPSLFPYTTLFRSAGDAELVDGRIDAGDAPAERAQGPEVQAAAATEVEHPARSRAEERGEGLARDRKSTRLNSSHLGISYAVFCLKKKNRI